MTPQPAMVKVRGYALVACVLLLVGASVAAAAMLRTATLQERIAGNTREKQRAFEAAQAALRYGERWLASTGGGSLGTCAGVQAAASLMACTNPLGKASCLITLEGSQGDPASWPARFEFSPSAMSVADGGGLALDGDVRYARAPGLYIEYAGPAPAGQGRLYCITAYAAGGSSSTLSVVRSVFLVP